MTTRQYRPVAVRLTDGTTQEPPLSIHAVRELASAVNNAKGYALANKVRSILCFPPWQSPGADDERVLHVFAPFKLPDGYKLLRWYAGHERVITGDPVPADIVSWTLRSVGRLYVGPDIFDDDYCEPSITSATWSTANMTEGHQISTGTLSVPYSDDTIFLLLTAQRQTTAAGAKLTSLDLIPRLL